MSIFVQREVSDIASDPSPSGDVMLLIGYEGERGNVRSSIESLGGEILEELPFRTLKARVPENEVQYLLTQDSIESVEKDSGMETLSGN